MDYINIQKQRSDQYGGMDAVAATSQAMLRAVHAAQSGNCRKLTDCQMEAVTMVLHKISRIVNGDPTYLDSWVDASSYLDLGAKHTKGLIDRQAVKKNPQAVLSDNEWNCD